MVATGYPIVGRVTEWFTFSMTLAHLRVCIIYPLPITKSLRTVYDSLALLTPSFLSVRACWWLFFSQGELFSNVSQADRVDVCVCSIIITYTDSPTRTTLPVHQQF